jgi:putative transposase
MRCTNFSSEEYFHVYNRGANKINVFNDHKDYERFIESLYLFNCGDRIVLRDISKGKRFLHKRDKTMIDIGAYCLMPNHFHLLIKIKNKGGISAFMHKLLAAYTLYFNKKHKRDGVLFQGSFKAAHVTNDEYLKYLFAYIHLNPIKIIDPFWREKGIDNLSLAKKFLSSYRYSSYTDYLEEPRKQAGILNKKAFPEYFDTPKKFEDFVDFWLELNE